MNEIISPQVSVLVPIEPSLERVKLMLFRPFTFEKWIAIAFCAWLGGLAEGGSSYSYNQTNRNGSANLYDTFWELRDYIMHNLLWIIPLATFILITVIAVVIGLLWISSRGKFMFLHCVVLNVGEVSIPWSKYKKVASSYWKFRMVLMALSMSNILFFMTVLGVLFLNFHHHFHRLGLSGLILITLISMTFSIVVLVLMVIGIFTRHFVAPIMFLRGGTCADSWLVLIEILKAHWGRFLIYLLFQIVLAFAFIVVILIGTFCTCCIAGLLLLIPFLGTVLLLPVSVFFQSYQLYYLAQYGSEFDLFPNKAPIAP